MKKYSPETQAVEPTSPVPINLSYVSNLLKDIFKAFSIDS